MSMIIKKHNLPWTLWNSINCRVDVTVFFLWSHVDIARIVLHDEIIIRPESIGPIVRIVQVNVMLADGSLQLIAQYVFQVLERGTFIGIGLPAIVHDIVDVVGGVPGFLHAVALQQFLEKVFGAQSCSTSFNKQRTTLILLSPETKVIYQISWICAIGSN